MEPIYPQIPQNLIGASEGILRQDTHVAEWLAVKEESKFIYKINIKSF